MPEQDSATPEQGRSRWWQEGEDPDYRFTLANERTFLAWMRTALAVLAAAVALEQLVPAFSIPGVRTVISLALAVIGLVIAPAAYRHWVAVERAMRTGRSMPRSFLMLGLSVALSALAAVVVVALLAQSR